MNIHEYQAKELLATFGVPVPGGHAAMSVEEAVAAANTLAKARHRQKMSFMNCGNQTVDWLHDSRPDTHVRQ